MKKKLTATMIAAAVTLGGCALADKAVEFATTPIHPTPTDGSSEQATEDSIPWREGSVEMEVSRDVDSVYPKVKREFGYRTREETLRRPQGEWIVETGAFKHVAAPGSMYDMSEGWVRHVFEGQERSHVLAVLLEKDGDRTDVVMNFWLQDPAIDMASYEQSLKERLAGLFD